jgi:hypothetical protein
LGWSFDTDRCSFATNYIFHRCMLIHYPIWPCHNIFVQVDVMNRQASTFPLRMLVHIVHFCMGERPNNDYWTGGWFTPWLLSRSYPHPVFHLFIIGWLLGMSLSTFHSTSYWGIHKRTQACQLSGSYFVSKKRGSITEHIILHSYYSWPIIIAKERILSSVEE